MSGSGGLQVSSMRAQCSDAEWRVRHDLAACYRLIELYVISDMMANHVSARVPGEEDAFLINAYGMLYEEITASSLRSRSITTARFSSSKPGFGGLDYGINKAGYVVPIAQCTLRAPTSTASSMFTRSRRWRSRRSSAASCPSRRRQCAFWRSATTTIAGVVLDPDERGSLIDDLRGGEALILRNHGALVVGKTIAEAFDWMHRLELACRSQLAAMACNVKLNAVPPQVVEETWRNYQPQTRRAYGVMEWPALLRKLDRIDPGYRD